MALTRYNLVLLMATIATVLLALTQTVHSQCLTADDTQQPLNKAARRMLYAGEISFTLSLLRAINGTTSQENIFFSPYSTYHALLLAYFGAAGNTEAELRQALQLQWTDSKLDVMQAYRLEQTIRNRRAHNSSVVFKTADKIFMAKEVPLRECMVDLFNEEYQSMDFRREPEQSRSYINGWIANVTENNIKDVLVDGSITVNTNIVLANAAFFKGQWASQFDAADTKPGLFYPSADKQVFVDMMYKKGHFSHGLLFLNGKKSNKIFIFFCYARSH